MMFTEKRHSYNPPPQLPNEHMTFLVEKIDMWGFPKMILIYLTSGDETSWHLIRKFFVNVYLRLNFFQVTNCLGITEILACELKSIKTFLNSDDADFPVFYVTTPQNNS
jgi:hypothetical protein